MMHPERGSILIESLVASVILALALITMLGAFRGSALRDRGLEDRRLAMLVAQSELAAVGSEIAAQSGTSTGSDGPYQWAVTLTPYDGDTGSVGTLEVRVVVGAAGLRAPLAELHSLTVPVAGR